MDKKSTFISHVVLPIRNGGQQSYQFPTTLRDVYACRVRSIGNIAFVSPVPNVFIIQSAQVADGYRYSLLPVAGSNNFQVSQTIASVPMNFLSPTAQLGVIQEIIHFPSPTNLHTLNVSFTNEVGDHMSITPGSFFQMDFYCLNSPRKHTDKVIYPNWKEDTPMRNNG